MRMNMLESHEGVRIYMRSCILFLSMGYFLCVANDATASAINVPAGDREALLEAISQANQSSDLSIIRLNAGKAYLLDLSNEAPEPVSTPIIIQGGGAHVVGAGDGSYGLLFSVAEEGTLEISDLTIRDFRGTADSSVQDGSLISNSGVFLGRDLRVEHINVRSNGVALSGVFTNRRQLQLERVRIVDVTVESMGHFVTIALYNTGEAQVQNVLIVDGRGGDAQLPGASGAYIQNVGASFLDLRFSSLIIESESSGSAPDFVAILDSSVGHVFTPETSVSGSMVVGMPCVFGDLATSRGYNLFTSPSCDLGSAKDLVGVSPGKLQFLTGPDGGVEIKLPPRSRALDRVRSPSFPCPGIDAVGSFRPQDGNDDGKARCDIGAFENHAGRPLIAGGASGLFYSAASDGHYVTLQEVRPDEYMIFWNTFDLNGNQAWVLGVGEMEANVISAQGFFQPSGMLVPGSGAEVDTSQLQEWGAIEIELADCLEGTFSYVSELSQFGSGAFTLDRLAFVEGLGCQSD